MATSLSSLAHLICNPSESSASFDDSLKDTSVLRHSLSFSFSALHYVTVFAESHSNPSCCSCMVNVSSCPQHDSNSKEWNELSLATCFTKSAHNKYFSSSPCLTSSRLCQLPLYENLRAGSFSLVPCPVSEGRWKAPRMVRAASFWLSMNSFWATRCPWQPIAGQVNC